MRDLSARSSAPPPYADWEARAGYYDALHAAAYGEVHAVGTDTLPWWQLLGADVGEFLDTWATRCAGIGDVGITTFETHYRTLGGVGGEGAPEGETAVLRRSPAGQLLPPGAEVRADVTAGRTYSAYWEAAYGQAHHARLPPQYGSPPPWWARAHAADRIPLGGLEAEPAARSEFLDGHAIGMGFASFSEHVLAIGADLEAAHAAVMVPYHGRDGPVTDGPLTRSDLYALVRVLRHSHMFMPRIAAALGARGRAPPPGAPPADVSELFFAGRHADPGAGASDRVGRDTD